MPNGDGKKKKERPCDAWPGVIRGHFALKSRAAAARMRSSVTHLENLTITESVGAFQAHKNAAYRMGGACGKRRC